jgi:quinol monooxygenase YgiN
MIISVIATLVCRRDADAAFQVELKKLLRATLQEDGCLSYEIYECNDEKGKYIVIDQWESQDALSKHKASPHYKYFMHIAPALLTDPIEISSLNRLV